MTDGPGTLEEKLYAHRRDHFMMGKSYDEKALRLTLGLPKVEHPELFPESPERKRLVRMDDREAKKELEEANALAEAQAEAQKRAGMLADMKDQQIQDLQRQIEEMRAAQGGPTVTVVPTKEPELDDNPQPSLPQGGPTKDWTIGMMRTWLEQNGLPDLPRKGVGITKLAALEHCVAQQATA